ncbi:MAG: 2-C-methyl-D-erythritol 4-phosphate cytidylyltransferase [Christensenellales bacterium]|jgi:2-C-methyl-D-erythritol 4-phosphate cytidylyltransferase/2-C-methyl-D-erythritol 2,4-cyclodiphosphate synthase
MNTCGIVVAAGAGTRLGAGRNKALLPLCGQPLFVYALRALRPFCGHLILVIREQDRAEVARVLAGHPGLADTLIPGGQQRRHSVEHALQALPADCGLVLIHDAARPLTSAKLVEAVRQAAALHGAAVPALPVDDTLRRQEGERSHTVPRERLCRVQTPQGFLRSVIEQAYAAIPEALTDDAGLVEQMGLPVALVPGEARNFKITRQEDWDMAQQLLSGSLRVGAGFDTHRLAPGRDLVLGGVVIPHPLGLLGHSDADAALHALMDALLGACALGDIGQHFPDSRAEFKDISSLLLLEKTARILRQKGFEPWQCDVTIIAQAPKLAPFIRQMRLNIARALGIAPDRVSVKATTTEGLGFEGRQEGISAQASALVMALPGDAKTG